MTMEFKAFRCAQCGHRVELCARPDAVRMYRRGVPLHFPDDFPVPSCPNCGELYLNAARSAELDARLYPAFITWQKQHARDLIERLKTRHGVSQGTIGEICGVDPTYLSHVVAGRKAASETLLHLLEAYVAAPGEFERQSRGHSWDAAYEVVDVDVAFALSMPPSRVYAQASVANDNTSQSTSDDREADLALAS